MTTMNMETNQKGLTGTNTKVDSDFTIDELSSIFEIEMFKNENEEEEITE